MFYSYAVPEPAGSVGDKLGPVAPSTTRSLGEFVLPYAVVQAAANPDEALLEFLQTTYVADAGPGELGPRIAGGTAAMYVQSCRRERRSDVMPVDEEISCTHLDQVHDVKPRTPNGCEECLTTGTRGSICGCASAAGTSAAATTRRTNTPPSTLHHAGPAYPVLRAGRGLGLVLRRRGLSGASAGPSPPPLTSIRRAWLAKCGIDRLIG